MKRVTRFLTAAMVLLAGLSGRIASAEPGVGGLKRFEYQQILMGVPVRIVVYAGSNVLANTSVHAAFDRIRQLNLIFSDYDEDSEISRLCATSGPDRPVKVSAELAAVLANSLELARRSEGTFDVTIGPLVQLWRKSRRTKQLPTPQAIAEAKQRVGYQWVRLDRAKQTVELLKPGMRLDFGGIVKGYAADEARAVLRERGLPRALVALSGDISAGEPPPGQPGWRIGIQGVGQAAAAPDEFVWLRNMAVSTAGDVYQFVEIGGKRYAHLIDPKTGLGITRSVSVTVIAPKGITSDGLDSAAAILGPEKGMQLLKATPGIAARMVELDPSGGQTVQSFGLESYLVSSGDRH